MSQCIHGIWLTERCADCSYRPLTRAEEADLRARVARLEGALEITEEYVQAVYWPLMRGGVLRADLCANGQAFAAVRDALVGARARGAVGEKP